MQLLTDLVNVDEIGIKIAESVHEFFASEENMKIINRLKILGFNWRFLQSNLKGQTDMLKGEVHSCFWCF